MGLNDGILDFEGRSPIRNPFYESHGPWIFSDFPGKFRNNPDQVARKPDFWLRTCNNDSNTEGWELGRLILSLKWLSMLQTCLEFVLI